MHDRPLYELTDPIEAELEDAHRADEREDIRRYEADQDDDQGQES